MDHVMQKLTKKGKEWVGLSPFTNEKSPSFYVNDQKRIFKDFSSGIGGDVISFVMETERLSFMEAVEKLAEEAGMQLGCCCMQLGCRCSGNIY